MNHVSDSRHKGGLSQRYYPLKDAAIYLGLGKKTLYAQASKGLIPAHKIGRVWRFDRDELDAFVHAPKPASPTVCYNALTSRSGGFSRKGD